MAINLADLAPDVQKRIKKQSGTRVRISTDLLKRHAIAVTAMLLDERELSTSIARRVLQKAIKLLK